MNCNLSQEINQLTKIFALCGTPDNELTEKIISEEVLSALARESAAELICLFLPGEKLHQIAESDEEAGLQGRFPRSEPVGHRLAGENAGARCRQENHSRAGTGASILGEVQRPER